MRYINCDIQYLNNIDMVEEFICFGISKKADMLIKHGITKWLDKVIYFVDNNYSNSTVEYVGRTYDVREPRIMLTEKRNYAILIMCGLATAVSEILNQIEEMKLGDVKCYSVYMMENVSHRRYDNSSFYCRKKDLFPRIEKKIHCCWFSGENKPSEYIECMNSWKRNCPDYEIFEWNADNYDVEKNKYMRQALQEKAWAFVSDYARLDLVYNFGGIYLDMDVEILKPIDEFLMNKAFFSFEVCGEWIDLGSGFGAEKGLPLIKMLMEKYDDEEFIKKGRGFSSEEIVSQPIFLDDVFKKIGYIHNSSTQIIDDMLFLSPDFINTVSDPYHDKSCLRGKEYAVHWHHAGWYNGDQAERVKKERNARIKILSYNWESVKCVN